MRGRKDESICNGKDFHDYVAANAVYELCELFHQTCQLQVMQSFEDEMRNKAASRAPVNIKMEIVREIFKICERFFLNEQLFKESTEREEKKEGAQ